MCIISLTLNPLSNMMKPPPYLGSIPLAICFILAVGIDGFLVMDESPFLIDFIMN